VLFSSRVIPGNDRAIGRLQNDLAKLGVEIVTERDNSIHVSGHPAREELIAMYQWVRPQIAVPVHGEYRHLTAHARLAHDCQVPQSVVSANGDVIRLAPGPAKKIGEVYAGRLGVDGKVLMSLDGEALRLRHRMLHNGTAVATLVLDDAGLPAAEPQISIQGLLEPEEMEEAREEAAEAVRAALDKLKPAERRLDSAVKEAVRLAVRKTLQNLHGKKPLTEVHLVRL
jgi:ribonuclease J